jgi:hypothetical protein
MTPHTQKLESAAISHLMKQIIARPPISLDLLTETLAAIHWNIAPYEGHPDLQDHPHIIELALAYNKIIYAISPTCKHDFQTFKF